MPLLHLLRQNPVIAAVKDNASLQLAIDSECQFISVLYGNICTISKIGRASCRERVLLRV